MRSLQLLQGSESPEHATVDRRDAVAPHGAVRKTGILCLQYTAQAYINVISGVCSKKYAGIAVSLPADAPLCMHTLRLTVIYHHHTSM